MTTVNITEARNNLYNLVDSVYEEHNPIFIKSKRNNAVLVSEDDWLAMQETLYLLSNSELKESILKGMKTPIKKCIKELDW